MQKPVSARNRHPSTSGKTNLEDQRRIINDPLRYHHPFTPRDPFLAEVKAMPPVLPKSIYPTIPEGNITERRRRPLTCPNQWMDDLQRPKPFEKSAVNYQLSEEDKKKHSREFLEQHQNELWRFDSSYAGKTPRVIYQELIEDRNFNAIMTKHKSLERSFKLCSSNGTKECLKFDADPTDKVISDTYLCSLNTARTARNNYRMEVLTQCAKENTVTKFRRGYDHAPEYGNFSKFNSVLKSNKAAVMKR